MQIRTDHLRATRLAPTLAGAGLAAALLLPGVAAAQDVATDDPEAGTSVTITGEAGTISSGDILVTPVTASGSCGTVTITSVGVDGSQTVETTEPTFCEAPILAQGQGGPIFVGGDMGVADPFGDPYLMGGPIVVSGGAMMGGPGLPGVVTVAAEAASTVEVTAVDGANVTLQTDDGWTRTVDTTNVAITLDADTLAASDLKAGDRVQVIQVRNANDTYTITGLAVVLPEATGPIGEITETGFTITEPDGTKTPVVVTDETRWPMAGFANAPETGLDTLKDGDLVHVRGSIAEDGTMTATEVLVIGSSIEISQTMPMPEPPLEPTPVEPAPTPEASPAA